MDKKKKQEDVQTSAEELLKSIDAFLDTKIKEDLKKSSEEEDSEALLAKGKDEEDEEESDEEEAEEMKKKAKKAKKACDMTAKKSFEDDPEYKDFMEFKKAKAEKENEDRMEKSLGGIREVVEALAKQVEALAKQPATVAKSVDGLKAIEKGDASKGVEELTKTNPDTTIPSALPKHLIKAKVANILFEKGIKSKQLTIQDVAEYESTGSLQDPMKKALVKSWVDAEVKNGTF